MKLSTNTMKILNNFAAINNGMIFKVGNVQYTIAPLSTIIAKANLPEVFDTEFGIYDLVGFLKLLKTFNEPEIILNDGYAEIVEGKRSTIFHFSDTALIVAPKKLPYAHDDTSLQFLVSAEDLSTIQNVSGISTYFKYLKIYSKDNQICLSLTLKDKEKRAINSYTIVVGSLEEQPLKEFCFYVQMEVLKILEGDYEFVISKLPNTYVIRMINKTYSVTYWTSLETSV